MPKQAPPDLEVRILGALSGSPGGLSRSEILERLGDVVSQRTVIRRLNDLLANGALTTTGNGRALRYLLGSGANQADANPTLPAIQALGEAEAYVPMTRESEQVRNYVRKPVSDRRPVGYRAEFLENYLPNKTAYLPLAIRKRLASIGRPLHDERPAGTYARDILNRLLIDLSWASSRLEGNTYSRLETQQLIEFGRQADGKDQSEAQMILNHKAAIEMLVDNVDEIGFNSYTFMNLHANLSENLLSNPSMSGRLRTQIVDVSGTVFHPLSIPQQIEDLFAMILRKADAIEDPFEQAFFLMVQIPYLQPFIDMNKRVSRLAANIPFIKRNLTPLSFVDVPERAYVEGLLGIYEINRIDLLRDVFTWAYERSAQRFSAIQGTTSAPDPVRLRNREALSSVIGDLVRSGEPPSTEGILRRSRTLVRQEDIERFVEIALQEIANLHEGNVARYRIRLSEFESWIKATRGGQVH